MCSDGKVETVLSPSPSSRVSKLAPGSLYDLPYGSRPRKLLRRPAFFCEHTSFPILTHVQNRICKSFLDYPCPIEVQQVDDHKGCTPMGRQDLCTFSILVAIDFSGGSPMFLVSYQCLKVAQLAPV